MPRRAPTSIALGVCSALVLARAPAMAQSAENASDPDGDRPRVVAVDDVLHPRPGRVAVAIEATRTPNTELGLADEPPTTPRPGASFATPRTPPLCRAPCTLFLPPGPQRLVGDATTDFPWSVDLRVPAVAAAPSGLRVRVRGHLLGLSALGGVSFILGLAGAVGGPAVIIISAIVGEPRVPVPLVVGGSIGAVLGGALIASGYALIGFAAPRIESSSPRSAAAPRAWRLAPVPTRDGAMLTAAVLF